MKHASSFLKLVTVVAFAAALPPLACAGGLGRLAEAASGGGASGITAFLVDRSGSVQAEDAAVYRQAFETFGSTIKAGDRVVIGLISDKPIGRFVPHADRSSQRKRVNLDDREAVAAMRKAFQQDIESALRPVAVGTRSLILDGVTAAADVLAGATQSRRRLVILSDGVEESGAANFAVQRVTPDTARKLVERRKAAGALPSLNGVDAWVIGLGGRSGEEHARLRMFWTDYLTAIGAKVVYAGRSAPEVK